MAFCWEAVKASHSICPLVDVFQQNYKSYSQSQFLILRAPHSERASATVGVCRRFARNHHVLTVMSGGELN